MPGAEPPIPGPEYDDPKEVYAFFGLTFYCAQVLEQGLVNLAVALKAKGVPGVTFGHVGELYERFGTQTFAQLLGATRKVVDFPAEWERDLMEAVKKRNYLAHRFFVEHSYDHATDQGRRKMIDELREILAFLKKTDRALDDVWHKAWEALGITQEWWDRQARRLIQEARDRDA